MCNFLSRIFKKSAGRCKKRGLLCFCATKSYRSQHIRIDVWFFMRETKSSALDLYFCKRKSDGKRILYDFAQKRKIF